LNNYLNIKKGFFSYEEERLNQWINIALKDIKEINTVYML
jgi:hypothetical protein